MVASRKKVKTVIGHDFEHRYFGEGIGRYVLAILFFITLIVLADWPRSVQQYLSMPSTQGFYYLGLSIAATVLIVMALSIAWILPHFEPSLRPKGFRRTLDKRTLTLMLTLTLSILFVVGTALLLISISSVFGGII